MTPTLANSVDITAALARANHTGTQAQSTITGLVADLGAVAASALRIDDAATPQVLNTAQRTVIQSKIGVPVFHGLEWAHAVRAAITTTGLNQWKLFGDSTLADGYFSTEFTPGAIISRVATQNGWAGSPEVFNLAVGGSNAGDLNIVPNLSATTKLIVIKHGINDGANPLGTRLATFETNIRAQLASIRASTHGTLANLTIFLFGPTSTNDTPNGRDADWYNQLRSIYIKACNDYKCCFFDAYNFAPISEGLAGISHDNPYADGRAIHYGNQTNALLWGTILENLFPSVAFGLARNRGGTSNILQSATPNDFPLGTCIDRAILANGWALDGQVTTHKNRDTTAMQILTDYAGGTSKQHFRSGAGASWQPWERVVSTTASPVAETPTATHTLVIKNSAGNLFKVLGIPV